jgi:RNA polymerase sigma factor (sigma-70 family)
VAKAEDAILENLNEFVAFARKRVGDPELAADLVQESLLKALKAADRPAESENAVAWFYRILRHSIIDIYRRRDVRNRALERFEHDLSEKPDAETERTICQCVKRLLPGLPKQYRDVLERVDLGGAPPSEVASALGLTTNNLNVRLHRARQRLREKVEATCRVCSKHGCIDCSCDDTATPRQH